MTADTANGFRQAADRALDFLAAHVDADGRSRIDPNDPGLHFKLPYVFAYGDRRQLALRALDHIERNLLADDGSFKDDRFNGPTSAFLYQAGWLAWSSAALGRFDLARRIARRAIQEQDPELGGFWNETHQGREQAVESEEAREIIWRTQRVIHENIQGIQGGEAKREAIQATRRLSRDCPSG